VQAAGLMVTGVFVGVAVDDFAAVVFGIELPRGGQLPEVSQTDGPLCSFPSAGADGAQAEQDKHGTGRKYNELLSFQIHSGSHFCLDSQ
jgi:hypothetical protein